MNQTNMELLSWAFHIISRLFTLPLPYTLFKQYNARLPLLRLSSIHSTHSDHCSWPPGHVQQVHMKLVGFIQWFVRLEHHQRTALILGTTSEDWDGTVSAIVPIKSLHWVWHPVCQFTSGLQLFPVNTWHCRIGIKALKRKRNWDYKHGSLFHLVGGFNPSENISQLGWLFPIYGKIKNVWNHQPVHWLNPHHQKVKVEVSGKSAQPQLCRLCPHSLRAMSFSSRRSSVP